MAALAGFAQAQVWCPPGATWHREFWYSTSEASWDETYVGDTLVDGFLAQRIVFTGAMILGPGTPTEMTIPISGEEFTALEDSLLLVRIAATPTAVWDTLLRFDALPGDQWFLPGHDLICSEVSTSDLMQILDTGHVDVDGVTLRYWDFGFFWPTNPLVWAGRYYERFGHPHALIPQPTCGVATEGFASSCYRDDELLFPNPFSPSADCGITLNAPEVANGQPFVISPNPGTDHILMTLPPGAHVIALFDALGRPVRQLYSSGGQFVVDTQQLASGVYSVRVDDGGALIRWVKE